MDVGVRICSVTVDGLTVETSTALALDASYEFGLTVNDEQVLVWGRVVRTRERWASTGFRSDIVFLE